MLPNKRQKLQSSSESYSESKAISSEDLVRFVYSRFYHFINQKLVDAPIGDLTALHVKRNYLNFLNALIKEDDELVQQSQTALLEAIQQADRIMQFSTIKPDHLMDFFKRDIQQSGKAIKEINISDFVVTLTEEKSEVPHIKISREKHELAIICISTFENEEERTQYLLYDMHYRKGFDAIDDKERRMHFEWVLDFIDQKEDRIKNHKTNLCHTLFQLAQINRREKKLEKASEYFERIESYSLQLSDEILEKHNFCQFYESACTFLLEYAHQLQNEKKLDQAVLVYKKAIAHAMNCPRYVKDGKQEDRATTALSRAKQFCSSENKFELAIVCGKAHANLTNSRNEKDWLVNSLWNYAQQASNNNQDEKAKGLVSEALKINDCDYNSNYFKLATEQTKIQFKIFKKQTAEEEKPLKSNSNANSKNSHFLK